MKRLIVDTDPGVDDSMAIIAALNSPELEVLGLTTIYGNVRTATATKNALILLERAGQPQIPVAAGSSTSFVGREKLRVADFVHGSDGLGNTAQAPPKGTAIQQSAAEFIVDTVRQHPGEITVLALGPLTNVALAMRLAPDLCRGLAELVILGGAYFVNGNVNPAAEANIFGDPEAADYVFSQVQHSPCKTRAVGLDVTHKCCLSGHDLKCLGGKHGPWLSEISQFYLEYHRMRYDMNAVHVHDPMALAAVLRPTLFTWHQGPVRVVTEGLARGMTIMDVGNGKWMGPNDWSGQPKIAVALAVDSENVRALVLDLLQQG